MRLNGRVSKLEALDEKDAVPLARDQAQAQRGEVALLDLLELAAAAELLERVAGVLAGDDWAHPLRQWLRDLRWGFSRIPPDVAPDLARRLFEICLGEPAAVEYFVVCNTCGLQRPRRRLPPLATWQLLPGKLVHEGPGPWWDLPADFFGDCPHCHGAAWSYAHLCGPRWLSEGAEP
jgi:hypothetical protein